MITAPNSPSPAAKAVMAPDRMPGEISGRVSVTKRSSGPAPSVRAAASSPGSTESRLRRTARTISGKDMVAVASEAPAVVKTSRMPNQSFSSDPTGPRMPKVTSSSQPTTTGGITSGRWTKASSRARPGKRRRASSQATSTAGGRPKTTERSATSRLRRTACHSSGVSQPAGLSGQVMRGAGRGSGRRAGSDGQGAVRVQWANGSCPMGGAGRSRSADRPAPIRGP